MVSIVFSLTMESAANAILSFESVKFLSSFDILSPYAERKKSMRKLYIHKNQLKYGKVLVLRCSFGHLSIYFYILYPHFGIFWKAASKVVPIRSSKVRKALSSAGRVEKTSGDIPAIVLLGMKVLLFMLTPHYWLSWLRPLCLGGLQRVHTLSSIFRSRM